MGNGNVSAGGDKKSSKSEPRKSYPRASDGVPRQPPETQPENADVGEAKSIPSIEKPRSSSASKIPAAVSSQEKAPNLVKSEELPSYPRTSNTSVPAETAPSTTKNRLDPPSRQSVESPPPNSRTSNTSVSTLTAPPMTKTTSPSWQSLETPPSNPRPSKTSLPAESTPSMTKTKSPSWQSLKTPPSNPRTSRIFVAADPAPFMIKAKPLSRHFFENPPQNTNISSTTVPAEPTSSSANAKSPSPQSLENHPSDSVTVKSASPARADIATSVPYLSTTPEQNATAPDYADATTDVNETEPSRKKSAETTDAETSITLVHAPRAHTRIFRDGQTSISSNHSSHEQERVLQTWERTKSRASSEKSFQESSTTMIAEPNVKNERVRDAEKPAETLDVQLSASFGDSRRPLTHYADASTSYSTMQERRSRMETINEEEVRSKHLKVIYPDQGRQNLRDHVPNTVDAQTSIHLSPQQRVHIKMFKDAASSFSKLRVDDVEDDQETKLDARSSNKSWRGSVEPNFVPEATAGRGSRQISASTCVNASVRSVGFPETKEAADTTDHSTSKASLMQVRHPVVTCVDASTSRSGVSLPEKQIDDTDRRVDESCMKTPVAYVDGSTGDDVERVHDRIATADASTSSSAFAEPLTHTTMLMNASTSNSRFKGGINDERDDDASSTWKQSKTDIDLRSMPSQSLRDTTSVKSEYIDIAGRGTVDPSHALQFRKPVNRVDVALSAQELLEVHRKKVETLDTSVSNADFPNPRDFKVTAVDASTSISCMGGARNRLNTIQEEGGRRSMGVRYTETGMNTEREDGTPEHTLRIIEAATSISSIGEPPRRTVMVKEAGNEGSQFPDDGTEKQFKAQDSNQLGQSESHKSQSIEDHGSRSYKDTEKPTTSHMIASIDQKIPDEPSYTDAHWNADDPKLSAVEAQRQTESRASSTLNAEENEKPGVREFTRPTANRVTSNPEAQSNPKSSNAEPLRSISYRVDGNTNTQQERDPSSQLSLRPTVDPDSIRHGKEEIERPSQLEDERRLTNSVDASVAVTDLAYNAKVKADVRDATVSNCELPEQTSASLFNMDATTSVMGIALLETPEMTDRASRASNDPKSSNVVPESNARSGSNVEGRSNMGSGSNLESGIEKFETMDEAAKNEWIRNTVSKLQDLGVPLSSISKAQKGEISASDIRLDPATCLALILESRKGAQLAPDDSGFRSSRLSSFQDQAPIDDENNRRSRESKSRDSVPIQDSRAVNERIDTSTSAELFHKPRIPTLILKDTGTHSMDEQDADRGRRPSNERREPSFSPTRILNADIGDPRRTTVDGRTSKPSQSRGSDQNRLLAADNNRPTQILEYGEVEQNERDTRISSSSNLESGRPSSAVTNPRETTIDSRVSEPNESRISEQNRPSAADNRPTQISRYGEEEQNERDSRISSGGYLESGRSSSAVTASRETTLAGTGWKSSQSRISDQRLLSTADNNRPTLSVHGEEEQNEGETRISSRGNLESGRPSSAVYVATGTSLADILDKIPPKPVLIDADSSLTRVSEIEKRGLGRETLSSSVEKPLSVVDEDMRPATREKALIEKKKHSLIDVGTSATWFPYPAEKNIEAVKARSLDSSRKERERHSEIGGASKPPEEKQHPRITEQEMNTWEPRASAREESDPCRKLQRQLPPGYDNDGNFLGSPLHPVDRFLRDDPNLMSPGRTRGRCQKVDMATSMSYIQQPFILPSCKPVAMDRGACACCCPCPEGCRPAASQLARIPERQEPFDGVVRPPWGTHYDLSCGPAAGQQQQRRGSNTGAGVDARNQCMPISCPADCSSNTYLTPDWQTRGAAYTPMDSATGLAQGSDLGARVACEYCGRKFNPGPLEIHKRACHRRERDADDHPPWKCK